MRRLLVVLAILVVALAPVAAEAQYGGNDEPLSYPTPAAPAGPVSGSPSFTG